MLVTPTPSSRIASEQASASVADLLLIAAKQRATSGLRFTSGERTHDAEFLSYPTLLKEAQCILGGLQGRVGHPGAHIALLLERPRDFIPAFWACILGGYVPCPLVPIKSDAERWAKHLAHVDALLDSPLFISTGGLRELPTSVASADLDTLRRNTSYDRVHRAALTDPAILMLTSGSTGNSKAVELTHGNLLASMAGKAEQYLLTSSDITLNWVAFDHVVALLEMHMAPMYVGATQLHTEPAEILGDPLKFIRMIHQHRVSITFAPNFLLGQINAALVLGGTEGSEEHARTLSLSCLRAIVTGGEANVVATGKRFLELLAPYGLQRNALWPTFGMTETCAGSVYSKEFPDEDTNQEFASVGLPIEGLEIRIVDEHGISSPGGETGELQLHGPIVFRRYYNNEEATRAAFTADGWFRSGDLGRIKNGRLSLVARSKDSIIVNGVNYFSHELETQLEQLDGIQRSFVAAFPTRPKGVDTEQLVVTFVTTFPSSDEDRLYQLVVAVRNTTIMLWGFRPAVILALPREDFPKTSLGKIQRSLMRKRFESGHFLAAIDFIKQLTNRQLGAYVPPNGAIESAVAEVFAEILGLALPALSATASFFDLGGTSLDILKLTKALDRRFAFKAAISTILQTPSVRQLANRISSGPLQLAGAYDPVVPLQITGRKTPLFCVHPGNGEILVLVNLAKYFLNDRPFYALRASGFNEGEECLRTVTEIVQTYLNAILKRQPHGPYILAGYSLGFAIAFEIAKELEARGEQVAFLGCIDWYPCYKPGPVAFNIVAGLAFILGSITPAQYEQLNTELGTTPPNAESCEYVLGLASRARLAELDLDLHRFSRWAKVAHSTEDLIFRHLTTGRVNRLTVFRSDGLIGRYSKEEWCNLLKRWNDFALQCRHVEVAGNHHTLMAPEHVASFQATLRAEVDLALQEH